MANNINYCVYKHTAPNNKVYIGITGQNPLNRWKNGLGYKRNPYFYNAILKYGWDNIKHEILYSDLTKEEAEVKEIELIALYDSTNREFGYNIENGGNTIGTHSEETRKKMSEKAKLRTGEKNGFYGKHHSEETRLKLIGRVYSEESRKKMSESRKGNVVSKENRDKMSRMMKNRHRPPKHKVIQIDKEGNIINVFDSINEACKNIGSKHVLTVLQGKTKTCCGYYWRYADE